MCEIDKLIDELGCSYNLACDLIILSGEDYDLIREASAESDGVHALKNTIIDKRFKKLEREIRYRR